MSKFALPSDATTGGRPLCWLTKKVRKLVLQTGRWASYRCRKCAGHADLTSRTGLVRPKQSADVLKSETRRKKP